MAGLAIFLLWRAFFLPRALAYVLALGCVGAAGYSFTFALSSGTKEGPLLILALAALVVNLPSILDEARRRRPLRTPRPSPAPRPA